MFYRNGRIKLRDPFRVSFREPCAGNVPAALQVRALAELFPNWGSPFRVPRKPRICSENLRCFTPSRMTFNRGEFRIFSARNLAQLFVPAFSCPHQSKRDSMMNIWKERINHVPSTSFRRTKTSRKPSAAAVWCCLSWLMCHAPNHCCLSKKHIATPWKSAASWQPRLCGPCARNLELRSEVEQFLPSGAMTPYPPTLLSVSNTRIG